MSGQLIYTKDVDMSMLREGIDIPSSVQKQFYQAIQHTVLPEESAKVTIVISGDEYSVTLKNQHYDHDKYPKHTDLLQLRYSRGGEFVAKLQDIFKHTMGLVNKYLESRQDKSKKLQIPESECEYVDIYAAGPDRIEFVCRPLRTMQQENLFEQYRSQILPADLKRNLEAQQFIKDFTAEFPRNQIMAIPMDRYLFAPQGTGYDYTFSYRLMYSPLASLGQCRPDIFGIYLKGGHTLTLSKTFENRHPGNYESAFLDIKQNIVDLLDAAEREDYTSIQDNPLNSAYKNILLSVYFPEIFMPAPTSTALNGYCTAIGIATDQTETMPIRNHALVEWKKSVSECEGWSNFVLMRFCDWLWRNNRTLDGHSYVQDVFISKAKAIEKELDDLHLQGETREAMVRVRVNQGTFRDRLLTRYSKCCLCGVSDARFLVASHIKPWAVSAAEERLDVDNGFLMCPNHDKLFDQGFITFNDDGKIEISPQMTPLDQIFMNVSEKLKINLTERNKSYLSYHRKNIFKKN